MDKFNSAVRWIFAAIGSSVGVFVGGVDGLLYTLVLFIAVDYVTGLLNAVRLKQLSSEVGFWGLIKKLIIFVMVGIANFIDVNVIGNGAVIRSTIIFFYISNEGLSVLENVTLLGVPFPVGLKELLAQIEKKEGSGNDRH